MSHEIVRRAATAAEAARLRRPLGSRLWSFIGRLVLPTGAAGGVFFVAMLATLFLGNALEERRGGTAAAITAYGFLVAGLLAAVVWLRVFLALGRARRSEKRDDLGGQWLWDWEVYGLPAPADEEDESLPPFPSPSFTVTRLPPSGDVLNIAIEGPEVPPEAVVPARTPLPAWARSREGAVSFVVTAKFEEIVRLGRVRRVEG